MSEVHSHKMAYQSEISLWIALLSACMATAPVSAQSSDDNLIQRYSEQGQRALADEHYSEAEQAFEKLRDRSLEWPRFTPTSV